MKSVFALLLLGLMFSSYGAPLPADAPTVPAAPVRGLPLPFSLIAPSPGSINLNGSRPTGFLEFGIRSDEVATRATLRLHYRPSPALLPTLSHLKVYLNEQLVGLVTITADQAGKDSVAQLEIDPHLISDFNRLRLELVGHYTSVCENPAHSSIWLDINNDSQLTLTLQKLPLNNDLAFFPEPFFDRRDNRPLSLPFVFAAAPSLTQQRAAAVLSSWFGARADWRGQTFPVSYNQLPPKQHAVVFATNAQRPDFLKDLPPVEKPTVEMISQPDDPYDKLLLILGKDDNDLLTAAQGIARGDVLLRGQTAVIDAVKTLTPRQPYDAPNWVRTDRPTTFRELQQYPEQLESSGMNPMPISLSLHLPPDLFLIRQQGIEMNLIYRYTSPLQNDGSRLAVNLNNQFVQDYPLPVKADDSSKLLHLPLIQGLQDGANRVTIPSLRLGMANQIRFDFDYATAFIGGTADGRCETFTPVGHHVVIDDRSTIDVSRYRHYLQMPSLQAFASEGFPFSRLADLSQTLVLTPANPTPEQVSTLLNALGHIGARTGYPALRVQLTDDWRQAQGKDDDLLLIGSLPDSLKDDSRLNLLLDNVRSWVNAPMRQPALDNPDAADDDRRADHQTGVSSDGPMAAIVGFQSPFHDQRSVVALLADSPRAWQLLSGALNDSGKRAAIYGGVTVIRESGVSSLRVGDSYYVGHLPWWERIWHALSTHPLWLALFTVVVAVLFALMLWRLMRAISRRRLDTD